ncbi:MAG: Stp1/IreP family PP2C-type Ser/Thr phosphatase [Oscillospiraceae bacterium]|jgi:protein phosphatase|nr:Stp1/IreP family PP2C-type Ser/Thr phosphatase [Oscillospiraceae bacterium]
MKLFKRTDIGKRKENQDTIDNKSFETGVLAVVCDGMGGGYNGKEASQRAANRFITAFEQGYNPEMTEFKELLLSAMQAANTVVYDNGKSVRESGQMMGTTCVAAFITKELAHIVNIGDSRAYLIRDNDIIQITTDHSVVQLMFEKGEITKEEMSTHPRKNVLLRVLGVEEAVKADYFKVKYDSGKIMLCSDGLVNAVSDEEILEVVNSVSLNLAATSLVEQAVINGGNDNISVVVVYN